MEFAYLDEAGDNGAKGSKYLVTCLMLTSDVKQIVKIVRECKTRLLEKNKTARWFNRYGELKFHNFPDNALLKRTLKKLNKLNTCIYALAFDKNGTCVDPTLKNQILGFIISHAIKDKPLNPDSKFEFTKKLAPHKIISDASFFSKEQKTIYAELVKIHLAITNKGLTLPQVVVLKRIKGEKDFKEKQKEQPLAPLIKIEQKRSKLVEELQALDLICGSIYQELEHKNYEFTDCLENIIKARALMPVNQKK